MVREHGALRIKRVPTIWFPLIRIYIFRWEPMCSPHLLVTFLDHEELKFEEAELSKKRYERVLLKPNGDTPNLVNTFTINLHWWALMSIEQHVHISLIVESHIRSGSCIDYKEWISGSAHFPLSLTPKSFQWLKRPCHTRLVKMSLQAPSMTILRSPLWLRRCMIVGFQKQR